MKKRILCIALALVCFACGVVLGAQWRSPTDDRPAYIFNDYGTMGSAAMGFNNDIPGEQLPPEAQWVAAVHTNNDAMEVTVYIKEDSGVPVTKEFVEASVKNTEGYTLKGVYTSPMTMEEALERMQFIKVVLQEYGSDEVWGETPWLICEIATDEEHGVHIRAAINDPIWGQAGYTDSDKNSLVACVNRIGGKPSIGTRGRVVWVDYIEPHRGFSLATYAQYPYNEEMM